MVGYVGEAWRRLLVDGASAERLQHYRYSIVTVSWASGSGDAEGSGFGRMRWPRQGRVATLVGDFRTATIVMNHPLDEWHSRCFDSTY